MPYASTTGHSNAASRSAMTLGGRAALELRMKRSLAFFAASDCLATRVSTSWCMVGTAEYQVGLNSSTQPKNLNASKPGEAMTDAPAAIDDAMQPMRPWMWNKGMTTRQRSAGVSLRAVLMLPAEITMLR